MNEVSNCPVCESQELLTVKTHVFHRPVDCPDPPPPQIPYTTERLWILFKHLLADKDSIRISIALCDNCGLMFTNPRMTAKEIALKYSVIERLESARVRSRLDPPRKTGQRAARIRDEIERSLGTSITGKRILDFGGAHGYNLVSFAERNDCGVIDWVKQEMPGGVEYLGRTLDEIPADYRFHLILLSHVLEHSVDPVTLLRELASRIYENGAIYVEVPLGAFREWRVLKEPLTHVNFFSEESLSTCMRLAGFSLLSIRTRFQWVTHGRNWCVNAIGKPISPGAENIENEVHPSPTRKQMRDPRLYIPLVAFKTVEKTKGLIPRR